MLQAGVNVDHSSVSTAADTRCGHSSKCPKCPLSGYVATKNILIPPVQSVSLNISFTQKLHWNTDFCAEYLPTSVTLPAKLQHKCLASELPLNWIQIGRNIHLC